MTTAPFPPTTTHPAQRVDVLLVTVTDAETQALPVAPSKLDSSALDKASETFAQLYNVRVSFSGGAAPPTPLFCRNCKVGLNLVLPPNPKLLKKIHTPISYGLLEPLENGRYWLHALLVSHAKLLLGDT